MCEVTAMSEKNDSALILDPNKLSRIQEENPFVRISDFYPPSTIPARS